MVFIPLHLVTWNSLHNPMKYELLEAERKTKEKQALREEKYSGDKLCPTYRL